MNTDSHPSYEHVRHAIIQLTQSFSVSQHQAWPQRCDCTVSQDQMWTATLLQVSALWTKVIIKVEEKGVWRTSDQMESRVGSQAPPR